MSSDAITAQDIEKEIMKVLEKVKDRMSACIFYVRLHKGDGGIDEVKVIGGAIDQAFLGVDILKQGMINEILRNQAIEHANKQRIVPATKVPKGPIIQ